MWKTHTICEQIPVTTYVKETVCEQVPVTVCKKVPVTVTKKVPCTVYPHGEGNRHQEGSLHHHPYGNASRQEERSLHHHPHVLGAYVDAAPASGNANANVIASGNGCGCAAGAGESGYDTEGPGRVFQEVPRSFGTAATPL